MIMGLYFEGDHQYYIDGEHKKWRRRFDYKDGDHGEWELVSD